MGDHVKSIAKTEVKDFHSCFLILGYGHFIKRHWGQAWFILCARSPSPLLSAQKPTRLAKGFSQRSKRGLQACSFPDYPSYLFYSWMQHLSFFNHWVLPYLHDLSKMVKMMCNETSWQSPLWLLEKPYLLPWACMHLGFPRDYWLNCLPF